MGTPHRNHANRTASFQGKRERQRRLKQIHDGKIKGREVTPEARYAAFGLIAPPQLVTR